MLTMPVLETSRLYIRPFQLDDLEATAGFWEDPEADREEELTWGLAQIKLLAHLDQPPYGNRAVVLKDTGQLIGCTGLKPCLEPFSLLPGFYDFTSQPGTYCNTTEMGLYYEFNPAYWRQGYATEAAQGLIDYAFDTLEIERIIAETYDDNLASQGVMRRLGMQILHNPHPEPA